MEPYISKRPYPVKPESPTELQLDPTPQELKDFESVASVLHRTFPGLFGKRK